MPEISSTIGIGQYKLRERPCVGCGGERDDSYAYTTNQGKRSVRRAPRCKACQSAQRKRQRAANPAHSPATCRKWRERNPEWAPAYNKRRQADPEVRALKAFHQRLRKARLRSGEGDTPAIRAIYAQATREEALIQRCPLFDLPELGKKMQVDHITPLARGGRHEISNLQIMAGGLNLRKGAKCPR